MRKETGRRKMGQFISDKYSHANMAAAESWRVRERRRAESERELSLSLRQSIRVFFIYLARKTTFK